MQCLKNPLFRLYSPILAALLGSSILLFALAACGGNPVNVGCTGVIPPQPSLHEINGVADFGDGNAVYALRASDGTHILHFVIDGKQLWSYQGRASVSTDGEGTVYVNSQNSLYALRAADSAQLWHFQSNVAATSQFDTQPLIVNGVVYVNAGSVTYALRARDGTSLWKTQTEVPDGTILEAEQGIIYVSSNGTVAALQASNGALLWNVNVAYSEPRVVVNGIIFSSQAFGGCSGPIGAEIFATRANHGKALWSFQI